MTPEQLVEIPGIGEKMVEKIHQSVAAYFEALEAQATAPPEEAALEGELGAIPEAAEADAITDLDAALAPESADEATAEGDMEAAEESAEAVDTVDPAPVPENAVAGEDQPPEEQAPEADKNENASE
jgi:Holliday junction resolvasome RuvABC DNA-binding subunit